MLRVKLKDGSIAEFDGANYVIVSNAKGRNATRDAGVTTLNTMDAMVSDFVRRGVMDADEGFFFARQLELIKTKSYDVRYAELKARMLFPVNGEGGAGITSITYRTYDQVGMAKIINAYADDLPRADVLGKETTIPVHSVGISYGYSLDEIRASEMTGASLDQRRANAAMRANEQVVNDVAFFGDVESGLPGLFDNPNIPQSNVVDPGAGTEWVNKTPDQILFDINDLFTDIFENTLMVESGNTLLLAPCQWSYIMSTPRSANSDTTIAQYVATNSPFLKSIDDIIAVNEFQATLNPTLSEDAMMAYDRSPEKLELQIPLELEMLAVQQKGLEFVVPGRSRLGGLNVYYPLSLAIAVGI